MDLERWLFDAVRAALLLGLALAAMPLLRRGPAAARRLVLALALGGALVLPAVSALAPAWRVPAPGAVTSLREPFREPLAEGAALPPSPGSPALAAARPSDRAPASLRLDPGRVLVAVWAAGALLVAARLALGLARVRAIVRRAAPAPSWARAVARAERETGLRAEIRMTGELDAPAVAGVLSPVVLVPRASDAWSDARRFAVLLHELAHVRRRDCLVQVLAQLACAAHWFDPLAWLAARRLRLERELAADDAVLAAGARASSYAEDLLAISGARAFATGETTALPTRPVPSGALGMAEPSQLALRIAALVDSARARRSGVLSWPRAMVLSAAAGATLFAVACATPSSGEGGPPIGLPGASAAPAISAASSTDARIQRIAEEELERTLAEWQATTGVIVVLDPATGEILANAGRAGGAPADVAVQRAYVTGSTLKAIVLAAALEEGVVAPGDRIDCGNGETRYGALTLRDTGAYGVLTVPEMLAVSSNVGFARVGDRLGGERLGHWLRRFHFGEAPAIAGAAAGAIPARVEDRSFEGAALAIGQTMTASPLQVAAAYAALANDGAYVAPTASRRGERAPAERIVRPETARAVVSMLEEVVNGERATGKKARIAGVRVAGKTGTAEEPLPGGGEGVYASFVGIVPADRPRFVVLVGVEGPRDGGYGGTVAAPAFAKVASRALQEPEARP